MSEATRRASAFSARWGTLYPAAVACLTDDLEHLTTYVRFPAEHWPRIRHSHLIERTFGESRRRVKVIGRLPGERSCLSLGWAVLDRAGRGWRGWTCSPPSCGACRTCAASCPGRRRRTTERRWSTRPSPQPHEMITQEPRPRGIYTGCETSPTPGGTADWN